MTRRWLWLIAILFAVFWFGHGLLLTWIVRSGLQALEPAAGVVVQTGHLDVRLNGPIEIRDLHVTISRPGLSTTDLRAAFVRLHFASFWRVIWDRGRLFSSLEVHQLTGTLDVRTEALPPPPFRLPVLSEYQKERLSEALLRVMPLVARISSPTLKILAYRQEYNIEDLNARLNEGAPGEVTAARITSDIFGFIQESPDVEGAVSWRNGRLTLQGMKLRDGIAVRSYSINLVKLGGIGMDWDLDLFGGTIRGDLDIGERRGFLHLGGTLSLIDLNLTPLPEILKLPDRIAGKVRDARLTYRGNPDFPMDSEVALRLSADDFRWNDRGWDSLEIGATYIGRRLYLSNFHLAQESNLISANGEAAIPEDFSKLPATRFFVNISADVHDVEALATLVGPKLGNTHGLLSLHGSLSGSHGELDGYINATATDLQIAGLPGGSGKVSAVVTTTELQVRHFEFWSGEDRVNAHATIALAAPHHYTGDLSLKVNDLGLYTPLLPADGQPQIFTGSADLEWQGDGTLEAHSGAFQLQLDHVTTDLTPSGITGAFVGTYSPENLYLGTVRLVHGDLALGGRLTLAAAGVNLLDLQLERSGVRLLTGEAFLPLDVFAMAQGTALAEALRIDRPVYARITSGVLHVSDLLQMAGQDADITGTVSLDFDASGILPELEVSGRLEGKDLSARFKDFAIPTTSLDVSLVTVKDRVAVDGKVDVEGFQSMTVTGSIPFAFERLADGGMRWFNASAPINGSLRFPDTSMQIIGPFLPGAQKLSGRIRGSVDVSGTVSTPLLNGGLTVANGVIELSQSLPVLEAFTADIQFDATKMTIRHVRGELGAGPFELTGSVDYSDVANAKIQLTLTGDNVLIYRDPGIRLRADLALQANGSMLEGGLLNGTVDLVDGRIFRRLEVTPLLVQSRVAGGGISIPVFSGLVPPPWDQWRVDVRLRNGNPFLLVGNVATGDISPDLTFSGTFGDPTVSGVIRLQNLQAYLPASDLIVPDGQISFTASNPFMPIMDVRGYADVGGIRVQAYAYGPLSNTNFVMRSDPPLSQENLILLVTTGVAPVGMSGAGLGVVAAGQGSIILLRSFARQLEPFGINIGGFVNRLGVSVIPPLDTTQDTSVAAEFRVTDRFSLIAGTDGYGFFNSGLQYTIRFR